MAKKKAEIRMVSYGLYTPFEKQGKELPRIQEFTTDVPARLGVEFGYILNIKKGRGELLEFTIDHPPFCDDSGEISPPFTGEVYVRTSDYKFFLGDTLWEPIADKVGPWVLTTRLRGEIIAEKTFNVAMMPGK